MTSFNLNYHLKGKYGVNIVTVGFRLGFQYMDLGRLSP